MSPERDRERAPHEASAILSSISRSVAWFPVAVGGCGGSGGCDGCPKSLADTGWFLLVLLVGILLLPGAGGPPPWCEGPPPSISISCLGSSGCVFPCSVLPLVCRLEVECSCRLVDLGGPGGGG
eukprot:6469354-Amphidinium_carterae.1